MPELPEVETVRQLLRQKILNKTIVNTRIMFNKIIHEPDVQTFQKLIQGQTIHEISRHAKYLIFELDNYVLISHLRMEGKYFVNHHGDPGDWKHILITFIFSDGDELRYHDTRRFGTFNLQPKGTYKQTKPISNLGVEPFDDKLTVDYLKRSWEHRRIAIKTALLEQKVIGGIGNIYANEIIFATRISPLKPVNKITDAELQKLIINTRNILKSAIQQGGTTIFSFQAAPGVDGKFASQLKIHGRYHMACLQCGAKIQKIKVNQRGTYYCPDCQKL